MADVKAAAAGAGAATAASAAAGAGATARTALEFAGPLNENDTTTVKLRVNHVFIERVMSKILDDLERKYLSGLSQPYKKFGLRHDFSNSGSRNEIFEWVVAAAQLFAYVEQLRLKKDSKHKYDAFVKATKASVSGNPELKDCTAIVLDQLDRKSELSAAVRQDIRNEVEKAVKATCAIYQEPEYALLFFITIDEQKAVERMVYKIVRSTLTKFIRTVVLSYKEAIADLKPGHKVGVQSPSKAPRLTDADIKEMANRTATDADPDD